MEGSHAGIKEKLDARSEQRGECLVWIGCCDKKWGYGKIKIKGRDLSVHRVAWELLNGPIPGGLHVLHSCDNPPCLRGEHLFLGTQADNNKDMRIKGRQARGIKNGRGKLTDDEVVAIRKAYAAGGITASSLANKYPVTRGYIRDIVTERCRLPV